MPTTDPTDGPLRRVLIAVVDEAARDAIAAALASRPSPPTATEPPHDVDAPLRRPGGRYATTAATSLEDALRAAATARREGRPFDVAFVGAPPGRGSDAARIVRRLRETSPGLRCALCADRDDDARRAFAARHADEGGAALLREPLDADEIRLTADLLYAATVRPEAAERDRHVAPPDDGERAHLLEAMVAERTAELRRAATTDRLTGLPNRAHFNERLAQAVEDSRSDGSKFALLYLDFDRFKVVNDSLGHQAGDRLLVSIASRLTSVLRANDLVASDERTAARLGGDEFVVLLTDLPDFDVAERVARRVLDALAAPHDVGGHRVLCTASIGLTTSAFGYERAEEVVRDADAAMYRAKAAGRSRVVRFDPTMHREALARMLLESELRAAVDGGRIDAQFQPIVRLAGGDVGGFEALARWVHPERGLIMPRDFIPVAEESGLIVRLGVEMMRHCFRASAAWRSRAGDACPYVTVNVSPKQLMDSGFLPSVEALLAETGALPGDVRFEVTENYLIADDDGAPDRLRGLRERGFGVFIDDFGTGYSSLSSLLRFPFSGMKIDRSFLESSQSFRKHAAVLRAMTALARDLEIPVIAEGVENSRQLALIETVGCDYAQGFYFARPMNRDDADEAVAAGLPSPLVDARA